MGIQGLLSFLEKSSRPINISEYSGGTVAIDSYCWLHKGAFSCAEKLARGEKTDQYVKYCMKFVNMLLSYNIKPILVFDGRHLPAKAETEQKRRELRESNRKKAAELLRLERESEARSLIQRCVDVTHEMALNLIRECRAQGVDCIVAPYEADAQLAFLNLNGFAHLVITEDSDLLLFGCERVVFKMDVYGNGVLVEQSKIPLAMKQHPNQFSMDKFRYMCILSGCDYLKSLPGIGLAKACKFIKKTQDDNISRALTRLGAYLNMSNLEVTVDYREKFVAADSMFKYQPVFDPRSRNVVPLTPLPPDVPEPLPSKLDSETSFQLALGNLNPFTMEKLDSWDPDAPQKIRTTSWKSAGQRHKSIWSKDYVLPKPLAGKPDPRDVKHTSTKGKTLSQPTTVLTQRISTLPAARPSLENELSRLRESFSVPAAKRRCLEDNDSGIATESSSEEFTPQTSEGNMSQEPEILCRTPPKSDKDTEFSVDDLLSSPILIGNEWRNPFQAKRSPQQILPRRSIGGALDKFSQLKKTQVEAACIVQSRYFSKATPETSETKKSPKKKANNGEDLNETLLDIINSTPSPKKRNSLLAVRNAKLTPKTNIFDIIDMEEQELPSPISKPTKDVSSPRKNLFSVDSSPSKCLSPKESQSHTESRFSVTNIEEHAQEAGKGLDSPKRHSFLEILDKVSKENTEEKNDRVMNTSKKESTGSFKWNQPLLDNPKKVGAGNSLMGLYKPKSKVSLPSKSPKSTTKKGVSSSPRGKPSLPDNANFKQKPPSTTGQSSLLNMFAFQPKPKLKSQ